MGKQCPLVSGVPRKSCSIHVPVLGDVWSLQCRPTPADQKVAQGQGSFWFAQHDFANQISILFISPLALPPLVVCHPAHTSVGLQTLCLLESTTCTLWGRWIRPLFAHPPLLQVSRGEQPQLPFSVLMVSCELFLSFFSVYNTIDGEPTPVATHSSILAWRIPRTEGPGGLPSTGSHRVGHDWSDLACMHALEKEMATHSSIFPWRIPWTEEPGRLPSMGSHDWSNLATAAAYRQNVVHWRREWQTTSVFLPWEPHEQYEKANR